jgi:hydroxyacylglutathione hydrolase
MIFRQITHDDLGCASYLVGDEDAGVAAVVDPRFEVDEYLELAHYMGVSIEHVFETHNHADHVSGHGRLAAATGASIHIHRDAGAAYDHEAFGDGDEWELGTLRIRALHTPGHRPEHTAFALIDTGRAEEPWAVLTGDTLFVNDVARPDLAIEKSEGARGIFRSLRSRLLGLPDTVEVWPGHLGGSMCGGPGMDMKTSSTIGFEKAHNETLAIDDEDAFVTEALAKLGPQPPNFEAIVELNRGPLLTDGVELRPLAPRQVDQKRAQGALLVDVRTDQQFDDAHIPGSVAITMLRAGFGSKLAWLADREQEIVFVGRDDEDGRRAGQLAVAVGIRRLAGFLHGGMTTWRQERREALASSACRSRTSPRRARTCRSSTCASRASGTPATSPARRSRRGTTSTACPTAWTRRGRSPSCAPPASGPPSRRACSGATAPSTSSTSSTAACRSGAGSGGRSSAPRPDVPATAAAWCCARDPCTSPPAAADGRLRPALALRLVLARLAERHDDRVDDHPHDEGGEEHEPDQDVDDGRGQRLRDGEEDHAPTLRSRTTTGISRWVLLW